MEDGMTEIEGVKKKPLHKLGEGQWQWFYRIFIKPRQVFSEVAVKEKRVWLRPMLVLSILVLILTLAGGPARIRNTQMGMNEMPEDFPYWSEEQQNQYFQGQAEMQGPMFIYIFPILLSLVSLWLGWFLLGNILHLMMTFKGSRQTQGNYLDLVAWAAIPFAIRSLVQIISLLTTRQVIDEPGFSGFIGAAESGGLAFLKAVLGKLDIYSLGFVLLLWIGAPIVSGLKPEKTWWVTILGVVIFLALASLPSFVASQLQGLGSIRPYLFF
jgi:membrane protein insertase Oxa1/YidC/SpoIIIJ